MLTPDGLKLCPQCGDAKPATTDYFYRLGQSGLQYRCKRCDCLHRGTPHGDGIYAVLALEWGVTPTRVQQIEASALRKLARNKTLRALWGPT